MRVIVAALILLVTALDYWLGEARPALQVAGLAAGFLVALTVLIDRLLLARGRRHDPALAPDHHRAPESGR